MARAVEEAAERLSESQKMGLWLPAAPPLALRMVGGCSAWGSCEQRSGGVWAETGHGHTEAFPRWNGCSEGLKVSTVRGTDRAGTAVGLYREFGDERDMSLMGVPACTEELELG